MDKFWSLYKTYKQEILYLFFGGCTFLISVITYMFFTSYCLMSNALGNILSWIIAVIFAYFTNKVWVFESNLSKKKDQIKEFIKFIEARISTLVVEEIILITFIDMLLFPKLLIKIIAQIVVIVSNYLISKLWIFK